MPGPARRFRGVARSRQFRQRRPAAPQSRQLPRRFWMKPSPAPSLALLSAITALAFCALHMVVPALPLLVQVFDDSAAHVQLVLSLYLGGIAAGQLIYVLFLMIRRPPRSTLFPYAPLFPAVVGAPVGDHH